MFGLVVNLPRVLQLVQFCLQIYCCMHQNTACADPEKNVKVGQT